MKKINQTRLIKLLIVTIVILAGLCVWLYWQKQAPRLSSQKQTLSEQQSTKQPEKPTTPSAQPPVETQPGDQKPSQPNHQLPRRLNISHQAFTPEGDYELRVYADYLTKVGAKCQLFVNQQLLATVELQNLPTSSICKGFTITENQLKAGVNNYRVVLKDGEFQDQINGEINK